jgi:hypothetical protein
MPVVKQRLTTQDDGTVLLRNTVDCSQEIEAARIANEITDGGRFGSKNDGCQLMGFIPPAAWNYDPWLKVAKRAQQQGDMREYVKNLQTFFRLFPAFRVNHKRTVWRGTGAILL